jgi:hypothetical protein
MEIASNSLSSQYTTTTGFSAGPLIKWFEGSTSGWSSGSSNPGVSGGSSSGAGGSGPCSSYSYTRTTYQSGTKYIAQSLTPSSSLTPTYVGIGLTNTCPDKLLVKDDSSSSPGSTLKSISFSTIDDSLIVSTSLTDSSGNSYNIDKTCKTAFHQKTVLHFQQVQNIG